MKKLVIGLLLALLLSGCGSHRPVMPTMDLPPEKDPPKIVWKTAVLEGKPILYLYTQEGLLLWEYLVWNKVENRELRNRIESLNKLVK